MLRALSALRPSLAAAARAPLRSPALCSDAPAAAAGGQSVVLSAGINRDLADVLAKNKAWADRMKADDPEFFERTARGQSPNILYIGCSDSRVPANQILDLSTNEVFVARNIANQVMGTDLNVQSVIQYAVEVLEVRHIIVCGHYDCGGVRAAMVQQEHGLAENWLRSIRDVYRLHADELDRISDPEERHRRLVELNVIEGVLNVYKVGAVQKRRLDTSRNPDEEFATPRVHGLVFDPADGILHKLDVNFKSLIEKYRHIYDLHSV